MKLYNICTCRVYQSQGQDKKFWPNVGTLTYFPASNGKDEGYRLELGMFPGTRFYVFPVTDQKAPESRRSPSKPETVIDTETGQERVPSKSVASHASDKAPATVMDGIEYPTEGINPDDIPF